MEKGSI